MRSRAGGARRSRSERLQQDAGDQRAAAAANSDAPPARRRRATAPGFPHRGVARQPGVRPAPPRTARPDRPAANSLRAGDRRAQSGRRREVQGFGDVEDNVIVERLGAIKAAPRQEHAAGRSRIVAAATQEEGVAQHRLVFAAAHDARAGGGGFQGETAPPHPGYRTSVARTRASSMASAAPAAKAASWGSVMGVSLRAQRGKAGSGSASATGFLRIGPCRMLPRNGALATKNP